MRTAICERLGVEFPLFAFSHCRDVVAAVTNAGGFGVLGAVAYTAEQLETELSRLDAQVRGRPYGVDVLVPGRTEGPRPAIPPAHLAFTAGLLQRYGVPYAGPVGGLGERVTARGATELVEVALKHRIGLIASALGPPPPPMVSMARDAGVPVAALVGTVEHARRQVAAGADLIVAQGTEAGGHTGEIATMVLVPQVVDAVDPVPVLAAGGIASGRQMAAAMALGAQGVWCGSVWLTTEEAETPPSVKRKMLAASSLDTVRSRSRTGKPARQLASAWTAAWDGGEDSPGPLGMPSQMLLAESAMAHVVRAAERGEPGAVELANYFVGQVVGQLDQVKPARRVVHEMMEEFAAAVERLSAITG
ncbi:NAD(P)H-dependent flavin oxidoreductase [Nonomuraea sp. NPDC004354]